MGVEKTTIAARVSSCLGEFNIKYPTSVSKLGFIIEEFLLKGVEDKLESIGLHLLFAAEKYITRKLIDDFSSLHNLVVLDRYIISGIIYGLINGVSEEYLFEIYKHLKEPDVTIILNVDPNVAYERIVNRNGHISMFEKTKEELTKASNLFLTIPELYVKYNKKGI